MCTICMVMLILGIQRVTSWPRGRPGGVCVCVCLCFKLREPSNHVARISLLSRLRVQNLRSPICVPPGPVQLSRPVSKHQNSDGVQGCTCKVYDLRTPKETHFVGVAVSSPRSRSTLFPVGGVTQRPSCITFADSVGCVH